MGHVYLAMSGQKGFETLCVVKRLLPALMADRAYVRRFLHEADLVRRLSHGNLVHTYSVDREGSEFFLVQEFVEGQDLSHFLEQMTTLGRDLGIELAVYIASEIVRGLAYAHSYQDLNLIHRDISPSNVRLSYAGEVKLMDFGVALSNLQGNESDRHSAAGKLWYLAPEQYMPDEKVDQRSDLYAVGVLLWEMLTHVPFGTVRKEGGIGRAAETEAEVMVYLALGDFALPSTWNPKVPPELDALVLRLLRVRPDERYENADQVRDALMPFLSRDGHPDRLLATELATVLPPEEERNQRAQRIAEGRFLLRPSGFTDVSMGGGSLATPPGLTGESAATPTLLNERRRSQDQDVRGSSRMVWVLSIGAGALLGLFVLVIILSQRELARQTTDSIQETDPALQTPSTVSLPTGGSLPTGSSSVKKTVPLGANPVKAATVTQPRKSKILGKKLPAVNYLALAREAFNQRDYPRALDQSRKAVAADQGAEAYELLGNVYYKLGKLPEAYEAYRIAVAHEPGNELYQRRLKLVEEHRPQQ